LGKDVGLALAVDAAVQSSRMEGWRVNAMKTKRVRVAIKKTLKGDDALADRVLELAKHQNDY
jgi:type I restriction enzyme R subunit